MRGLLIAGLLGTQLASSSLPGHPDRVEYGYHPDGSIASITGLRDGQKVGHHFAFWPGGRLRLDAWFEKDAYHGAYRTYYPDGRPYELRHYEQGREAGLQQSWTPQGELFLNYEVRDGRRYGLVNARPCRPVSGGHL